MLFFFLVSRGAVSEVYDGVSESYHRTPDTLTEDCLPRSLNTMIRLILFPDIVIRPTQCLAAVTHRRVLPTW